MKIKNAIIAAGMLIAVPLSASALSVSLYEGPTSGGAVAFATDQLTIDLAPFPSDLDSALGVLTFNFSTTNYTGTITATTSNTNTKAALEITGFITTNVGRPVGTALTIIASDIGYQLPTDELVIDVTGVSNDVNGDSDVALAAFYAADNNGGADATSLAAAQTDDPSAALIAQGSTGSGEFNGSNTFASIANDQFALNSVIIIDDNPMVQGGSTFFSLETVATVPVPAPLALLLTAIGGLGFAARSKKRSAA
ncbi:hypothetical protein KHP62_15660 [Rhodobacteraceae bacterium NNCM2]|nr:hypothetical protein [Coraliihabitans acroporae]